MSYILKMVKRASQYTLVRDPWVRLTSLAQNRLNRIYSAEWVLTQHSNVTALLAISRPTGLRIKARI